MGEDASLKDEMNQLLRGDMERARGRRAPAVEAVVAPAEPAEPEPELAAQPAPEPRRGLLRKLLG